jgi:hypothetical protein
VSITARKIPALLAKLVVRIVLRHGDLISESISALSMTINAGNPTVNNKFCTGGQDRGSSG